MYDKQIQFSIIIPTFNPDFKLFKTIESIKRSIFFFEAKHKIEYEIIIINDGGKLIDEGIKKLFTNIRYINLKKNRGVGFAREFGCRISKYGNIYYIDSDIIVDENTLIELYNELFGNSDAGSVGALQSFKNLNNEYSSRFVCAKTCYGFDDKPEIIEFSAIHSECCIIKRSFLRKIGGWNFYKKSGGEEFELGHKIISNNKKNYLTRKTRYATYYENLLYRCKKIIYRTSNYLPIFLKRKKFETKGAFATKNQSLSALLTILTFSFLFLSIYQKNSFYLAIIFFVFNIIVEFDFLKFSKNLYSSKDLPFFIIGIIIINISIFLGFIYGVYNLFKSKK